MEPKAGTESKSLPCSHNACELLHAEAESANNSTASGVDTKKGLNTDEWEAHREAIKQLYFDQDIPLKDTMAIMERKHGFKANTRNYKTRIKKWNLNKNWKREDTEAIARKTFNKMQYTSLRYSE